MPADIDAIIGQMEWAAKQGLSELTVTLGDTSLYLRRAAAERGHAPQAVTTPQVVISDATLGADVDVHQTVDAQMAGICHLSGDTDGAPFVSVGDKISSGQTLCIIEAMKVMTSVTATISGTISAVLIEDGASVSAHTPLFEVRP
jgi:acetyl-CoA carboxylase biotin carboxyl carrier protein